MLELMLSLNRPHSSKLRRLRQNFGAQDPDFLMFGPPGNNTAAFDSYGHKVVITPLYQSSISQLHIETQRIDRQSIMDSITTRLPPELIIIICGHLASESTKSLISLCRTSKRLYEIAYPIIYSDVRVKSTYGPNSALLKFSSRVQRYRLLVHSLDIRFSRGHLSAYLTGVPSASRNLDPTMTLLPGLLNLTTFIVQLEHHEKRNTRLPDAVVAGLLKKLPLSVRNLEVVTEGLEQLGYDERRALDPTCHCNEIAKLLPQLHHLRLRKGYLCDGMFKRLESATKEKRLGVHVPPYSLQSITIRLDMEPKWVDEPVNAALCNIREAGTSPMLLAEPLREAYEAGLLPDLKRALVISRFGRSNNLCTARKTDHSGFAVYDVINNCHTLIPVMTVETEPHVPPNITHETLGKWGDLFLVRDEEGLDRFATFAEISSELEANKTFRQLINTSPQRLAEKFNLANFRDRSMTELPKGTRMGLWIREAATGQCLLEALRVEGLGLPARNLPETLPHGWKYGPDNKKGERQIQRDWAVQMNSLFNQTAN
jgi:hypothetical protein